MWGLLTPSGGYIKFLKRLCIKSLRLFNISRDFSSNFLHLKIVFGSSKFFCNIFRPFITYFSYQKVGYFLDRPRIS